MKKLLKIKVSKAQLKMIVGDTVKHNFPTKLVCTRVGKEIEKDIPDTIENIIKETAAQTLKSFDDRFDKTHPVEVALNRLEQNGLTKTTIAAIRNNKACQKTTQIGGKWKFLNNFISDEHRQFIVDLLTSTKEAKILQYGEKYYA